MVERTEARLVAASDEASGAAGDASERRSEVLPTPESPRTRMRTDGSEVDRRAMESTETTETHQLLIRDWQRLAGTASGMMKAAIYATGYELIGQQRQT